MLPSHHLSQLVPTRVKSAIRRLQLAIWTDVTPLPVQATEARSGQRSLAEAKCEPREPVAPNTFWGRLFDQRWCRVEPPGPAGENTWLNWKDQGEATLYVDDQPYFGLNVAHRHCRLPRGTREVWLQSSCVQSGIAHPEASGMDPGGSYFEGAFLCRRDDDAWGAYHDLKCLFDVFVDQRHREDPGVPLSPNVFGLMPEIDRIAPVYRRLLRAMDEAVDGLDRSGTAALRRRLADAYREFRADKTFMRCVLTGHAHLDLVWMWPERIGEIKAVNIFATADTLMDEYPELRFAYSQPASYEAVQRREPALFERVVRRIREGNWQATGAMYVESDTLMPCGEALARSFVLGQKGFATLAGKPSKLAWLPDVFGYSACLPQIMRLNGVDYFFTTKMTWNAINRFPYSSFIWRGNDGSEVVAHVSQDASYVTHMHVGNIKNPARAHRQADVHDEFLLPTGYGDGGGGVTHEMCERARRLGALPDMPAVAWDHPEAFFERLGARREALPVHQGECYLEDIRGMFTTHGNLKAAFRGLERALFVAEAVAAATGRTPGLDAAWKRLVFAQFHDYIPGSSVWDVYLEGVPELKLLAAGQLEHAGKALSAEGGGHCLFNPHPLEVRRWVAHPETGGKTFAVFPPLGGTPLAHASAAESPARVRVSERTVANDAVSFTLDAAGGIERLTWEGAGVPLRASIGRLAIYPDKAAYFEAWNIDRHVLALGGLCDARPEITMFDEDGIRAGFRVKRAVGRNSEATVEFALEAGSPLVHIAVELDWQEPEGLLKLLVPTRYAATNARFGAPYGSVLRPQVPGSLAAEAMWEVPFSRHLEVFDEGEREGLMLVTEAKYGAAVRDGVVGLSLVRSPRVPGFDAHASLAWPAHLSRLKVPSAFSDIGRHGIRLALGKYDIDAPRERQPAAVAETLFTPPLAYRGKAIPPPFAALSGGETFVPCWSVPVDAAAWVLRFHEVAGRRGTVQVVPSDGWLVREAAFNGEPANASGEGDQIHFTPYQVLSLRFERRSG
jgi:alpha-mannosidase